MQGQERSENAADAMTLERSHRALQLLHDTSRSLYGSDGDFCSRSVPLFQQLEALLDIGPVRFLIRDPERGEDVQVATTLTRERPAYCRDLDCFTCIDVAKPGAPEAGLYEGLDCLTLPIRAGRERLGSLEVYYPHERGLEEAARKLLETLADQLATAIYLQRRMTERQQLSLMEERNIIARELHDSLAQSLSYLKMQVARLARTLPASGASDAQEQILDELRTGLNSAYRQLRELLTTFRLKLDTPGLVAALNVTVSELSERVGPRIELHCNLPPQMLSPNEEIHVLQIIREALTNAVKHAHATRIDVSIHYEVPRVHVSVIDDGVGLPGGRVPEQHYGLVIMRERALSLGGELRVASRRDGGVEVALGFAPKGSEVGPEHTGSGTP